MSRVIYILVPMALLCLGGSVVAAPEVRQGVVANSTCPVNPGEEVDPDIFVDHEGRRVYLCCNRCRKKFLADPAAYLAGLPQFAAGSHPGDAHADSAHDHGSEGAAGAGAGEHNHAAGHQRTGGPAKPLRYLGKFHPLVVHFPIALILTAVLAEALRVWRRSAFFGDAARFAISLGAIGAVCAAGLGWLAAASTNHPDDLLRPLFLHRWVGVSVAVLAVSTAALSHVQQRNPNLLKAYRTMLVASAVLVGIAGHLGATLIYGPGYFAW